MKLYMTVLLGLLLACCDPSKPVDDPPDPPGSTEFKTAVAFPNLTFQRPVDLQQLLRGDLPEREFDAHHLYALLALTIHAPGKPETSEFFFINLSFPEKPDLLLQFNNILFNDWILQLCPETLHSV